MLAMNEEQGQPSLSQSEVKMREQQLMQVLGTLPTLSTRMKVRLKVPL
jgi:hypothetical protein